MTATPLPYVTLDLSAGGMSRLQLALELGPLEERYVVLKWLDQESTAADPHASRRFLDEARLALELHHPNIVTVHQVLESEGRHCIVMAWIRGMSLRQVLQRLHPAGLPPRIASKVVHDLCRALHHAWHSRNERTGLPLQVVHRDLKPENVMLTLLGQTKVIDFGVAQATSLLTPSALHATPQYASPEQAGEILAAYGRASRDPEDAAPLDGRSDLFCAGLILQELLTGRPVFSPPRDPSTEAGLELLSRTHTSPVVPEDVPGALVPILRRALAFQRRHRYATGEDMADALARAGLATESEVALFLEGLFPDARQKVRDLEEQLRARQQSLPVAPVATPPAPLLLTPDMAWVPPARRQGWRVAAGVAGVLLVAGGGGALWYRDRMRPSAENSVLHVLPGQPIPEDGTFTLGVEVRNARGQPISGQPVRFEATGDSGARVELPDVLTDERGRAERPLSWQRPERVFVVPVLVGRSPLRMPAQVVTFEPLPPAAAQSSFAVSSPVKAGERVELSATLRDAHGHAVGGRPVRFVLKGTEARDGQSATDAHGRATFFFDTREAGDFTARASLETGKATGPEEWTALEPLTVRVVAGAPSLEHVTLAVDPARAVADDTATIRVVAEVRDAYGNPVAEQPVLLTAAGEGATVSQPGATNPLGVAEGTLRSARAQLQRVCARVGGLEEERCQEVLFLAGPPAGLSVVPRAREVAADGRALAEFKLRVADARDNPIADAAVRLSARGVGSLVERQLTTGPDGTALVHVRSRMTGTSTVTAQLEGTALTQRESVRFVAGSPDQSGSSVSVSPESALADGRTPIEVTVRVLDAEENPVRGRWVLLRLAGVGPEQSRRAGPTDEAGEASAAFTSIIAGEGSVSAELEAARPGEAALAIADARPVRFLAGLPGKPTLSVEPARGRVGTALQLTVEVWDESHRNPLSGTEVRWDVRGSSEPFTLAPSKTDEHGRATVSLTPNKAGNVTLVAKVAGDKGQELSSSLNVGIDSGPPHEVRLGVESGGASLRADGADRARLVLRLLDAQGNAVKGQAVHWEGVEAGDTLEAESDATDETGRIRATFATHTAGKRLLKAVVAGTSLEASLPLTAERLEALAPPDAGADATTPPGG